MPLSVNIANPWRSFLKQFGGESDDSRGAKHIVWFLETFALVLLITAIAGLVIALGSISPERGDRLRTFLSGLNFTGLGLLISCAAFAAGGVLGFLFGIPRVRTAGGGAEAVDSNTNLEQVSDWVTKIVVGLGLTQAYQLNGLLIDFSYTVQQSLPLVKDAGLAACLIGVGSTVAGFIAAYLKARTALLLAFSDDAQTVQRALSDLAQEHMSSEAAKVLNGRGAAADQTARDVATRLLRSMPDKTKDPALLKAIGLAYAALQNFVAASAALAKSVENNPADTAAKFLAVRAATLAGRTQEAASLADNTPPPPGPLSDDQIETSLAAMFAGLYDRGGFARVVSLGERLAQDPKAKNSGRLWLYLAAAYGQAFAATKAAAKPSDNVQPQLDALKSKALDAATQAKVLDAGKNLPILRQLWDPNAPGKGAGEDDLECFAADDDFRALLGPATAEPQQPPSEQPPQEP